MTRAPVTIGPDARLSEVRAILMDRHVHHVPVVNGRKLVGIVSTTDLLRYGPHGMYPSPRSVDATLDCYLVLEVMQRDPVTIGPDEPMSRAASLLQLGSFHALPVVDGTDLVGIVTSADLLRAFGELLGTQAPTGIACESCVSDEAPDDLAIDIDRLHLVATSSDAALPEPRMRAVVTRELLDLCAVLSQHFAVEESEVGAAIQALGGRAIGGLEQLHGEHARLLARLGHLADVAATLAPDVLKLRIADVLDSISEHERVESRFVDLGCTAARS